MQTEELQLLRPPAGYLPASGGGLHSADDLWEVVRYERLRSDRSGAPFSLVTITSRDAGQLRHNLRRIVDLLGGRLRTTDEFGLLGAERIGLVLPYTPAAGAWKLADDLSEPMATLTGPVKCRVFEYPSNWPTRFATEQEPAFASGLATAEQPPLAAPVDFFWKHVLDVSGALIVIVATTPLMLAAALAIKATSRGPIFFMQQREGQFGRPFSILKFRTMEVDAESRKSALRLRSEQDGPAFKMARDPRVTPIGRLLRVTSIDELPQLWNVLRRDMSLVGPRPLPVDESASCHGWQRRRLAVRPGMTCIWQVHGRSRVSFDEWIRMDLRYIKSLSLATDLKILLQTIPAVLFCRGAK